MRAKNSAEANNASKKYNFIVYFYYKKRLFLAYICKTNIVHIQEKYRSNYFYGFCKNECLKSIG